MLTNPCQASFSLEYNVQLVDENWTILYPRQASRFDEYKVKYFNSHFKIIYSSRQTTTVSKMKLLDFCIDPSTRMKHEKMEIRIETNRSSSESRYRPFWLPDRRVFEYIVWFWIGSSIIPGNGTTDAYVKEIPGYVSSMYR